ncbi:MAG: thiol:disulfide interchange protein tlpA [Bacteroidetes bacterium]|nr:thiol:disulfide interchange protein tlpA [Bacteroidota bacterium]
MILKKLLTVLFVLAVLVIAGWFYKAYRTVPALPAYENNLTDEQGQPVKIADFKGQYVLISYFQTWCGTCIHELPGISELQKIVGKDKLKVLLVSDEGMEKIAHFKERYNNTLDYYQSDKPLKDMSIRVFPTTYLLNKNGEVIFSKLEAYDWNSPEIVNMIK